MNFVKKPIVIEATQWFKNGDHPLDYSDKAHVGIENDEVRVFSPEHRKANDWEGDVVRRYRDPSCDGETVCKHCGQTMHIHGWIETLEGGHIVCPGDWIITGVKGEHYPCKPDIFEATYSRAKSISDGEISYHPTSNLSFGLAIEALKKGLKVARSGWNGKGLWLELQRPDEHSKMTLPYIFMAYPSTPASETAPQSHINARVPWLASQTDMLADDWQVVG